MSDSVVATLEPAWAAFVGLDWGDQKHAWSLQAAGHDQREQGFVDNTPEAVAAWAADLNRRFGGRPIAVALEQKRGSVVNLLSAYAHLVLFPVPPSMSSSYRKTFVPSGAKDDPGDAGWIVDLLLRHRDRLRRLERDDDQTRLLLFLVEYRRELVDDKTRLTLRLQDCLKQYFPQLLQWFGDVDRPLVADLLKSWPDLQHLQRCHDGTLRRFLREHHYRGGEEAIQQRIAIIRAAIPATSDPAVVEFASIKARQLSEHIAALRDQITQVERRRDELVAIHPDTPIFASFPGAGDATVPRLIAAFGTRRDRYHSAGEVACDSGVAPVHMRSGKTDRVSMRHACSSFTRQTFTEFAGQSIPRSEWAKEFYRQHCHRPEQHHAVLRALAFKWIRIFFRCWQDRKPYDEQLYLASHRRRNSLLGPALVSATSIGWKTTAGFSKLSEQTS
jgi:transposase